MDSSRLSNVLSKPLTQIDLHDKSNKASATEWLGTREPGKRGWGLDERASGERMVGRGGQLSNRSEGSCKQVLGVRELGERGWEAR